MRIQGHRERKNTHWDLRGWDGGEWGDWGGITLGEIPNVGDEGMVAANYQGMHIPM